MSGKGEQHRMLVDGILNTPAELRGKGFLPLLHYLGRIAPSATPEDIDKAVMDAAGILEERALVYTVESTTLSTRYVPLFEGMPAGTTLMEAAEHKAICGDPLGVAVFRELGGSV
ncbi:hypothetical protein LB531_20870 [Mesorhizobium sp. CO1-1-2]|uniref:hypothetical protein n=1 Tax=Mesorhizobium sp. CO1-1-2 TaxID=2876635 RepID=UPI001CCBC339|nr:hypothetical protein [Mesorhizobium sp. CO1-1-2]MBZ9683114.1 hypothetical protein [Mesorhizobium sp. CO1-1-2]